VSLWESEFPKVTALNNFCYVARSALLRKNSFCRRQKGREYVGHCNSRITPDELREADYAGLLLRMLDVKGYGNADAAA
jgi:hypothetical protein